MVVKHEEKKRKAGSRPLNEHCSNGEYSASDEV